jgi:hypothetical protein
VTFSGKWHSFLQRYLAQSMRQAREGRGPLRESGESIPDLVRSFSVSRASIYRALQSAELMALDEAVAAVK